ncbi:TetR/AcrR family transcriptional regulator [Ligilactobacillus sp. WILCCON 0076]|uniref:TetR/AcrR family transcriptional regulator n=1 Tax=Ligilactobacillus ubinensis TaxID=2876789 RepID=A0A9X2FHK7_9LACO|nr:TetR/AcrR family transcriptional regulator [Ligilactobacillus ubinensis]MCP0885849.1 TetR/AcrR family transcriptional regulator [Ligilactobacillus ubinensis]
MIEKNFSDLYSESLNKMSDLTPKQRKVLAAALELFSTQGFDATSSSQIAAKADVALGSVYQHFPNKHALLAAVLTPLFGSAFQRSISEFVTNTLSVHYESLDSFVTSLLSDRITYINNNFKEIKIMFGQLLTNKEFLQLLKDVFNHELLVEATPTIERLKEEGKLVNLPNDVIVQFFLGQFAVYFGKLLMEIKPRSLDEEITYSSKLVINALKPR